MRDKSEMVDVMQMRRIVNHIN